MAFGMVWRHRSASQRVSLRETSRGVCRYPSEHEVQEFDRVIAKVQEGESVPYYVRQADNPFRHPAPGALHHSSYPLHYYHYNAEEGY